MAAERARHTTVVDFNCWPSPITSDVANYWDPVHYREPVADRIAAGLAAAANGAPTRDASLLR